MQRYYVQYLSGYDSVLLNQLIQVRLVLLPHQGLLENLGIISLKY